MKKLLFLMVILFIAPMQPIQASLSLDEATNSSILNATSNPTTTIIIIDDTKLARKLAKKAVESACQKTGIPAQTLSAKSGREGLEIFKRESEKNTNLIIVVDLEMPDDTGDEIHGDILTQEIRRGKRGRSASVILNSSEADKYIHMRQLDSDDLLFDYTSPKSQVKLKDAIEKSLVEQKRKHSY